MIQVKAVDLDAAGTVNSKIIYSIESGNKDKFLIDSASGMVRINENSNLDRDLFGSFYTLKITATDLGSISTGADAPTSRQHHHTVHRSVPLSVDPADFNSNSTSHESFCFLTIKVLDVNNKKPKFIDFPR